MAVITAAMVKELREVSGAGMMDCKKALTECDGNMDEAMEFLRKNGQAKAEKKANRIAAEGLTRIATDGDRRAAIVEVNSETDFVAKNEKFQNYVGKVAQQALASNAADLDAFMAEKWLENPEETVSEALVEMIAVISEKLSIRREMKIEENDGVLATYSHDGGRISVVVDASTAVVNDDIREAVRNIAMQVAALSAQYVSVDEVPESFREHEKEIIMANIRQENEQLPENKRKPEQILEKQLVGRLAKELKEICLNDQIYVKAEDGKQTVAQYLAEVGRRNGTELAIRRFVRWEVGEGMEKKQENFAEEVMAQVKG
ncbi:translation elongation factor Ts [Lachnoclostridium sp. Marseille-P6806]|uniref:translation elongation factor Ts n=1 Tax=Lachnoclostridium sp. Marseille-P6806 TaxID=2364793 RepID=UPI0010323444|nr:translation elongation factor Ts [Lachnoclostridium sp. Marseille-P6806]